MCPYAKWKKKKHSKIVNSPLSEIYSEHKQTNNEKQGKKNQKGGIWKIRINKCCLH